MMKSNRAIRIHVCMVGNAWPTVVSDAASAMDTIPDGQYNWIVINESIAAVRSTNVTVTWP